MTGKKAFNKLARTMSRGGYRGFIQREDGKWSVNKSTLEGKIQLACFEASIKAFPPDEREEYRQFLVEQGLIPDRKGSPAGDAGQQLELFGDTKWHK